jgi:hypothetical protein
VFVFYVDTYNAVHVMAIGPTAGYDQLLNGQMATPWVFGCRGTSLATISFDADGGADVYYIGVFGDVFKFDAPTPLLGGGFGGFGGFGYKGDQTLTYGGVPAGEGQGGCLIG